MPLKPTEGLGGMTMKDWYGSKENLELTAML